MSRGWNWRVLDEVLPLGRGCSHEVVLTGGVIVVECDDLRFRWE
ncbi:hypothetical protein [Actinomadura graeca]|nr:hypothetical protein [Actinomadura graeca]